MHPELKSFVFLFLTLITTSTLSAQSGTVIGTVRSGDSQLAFATVTMVDQSIGTATNEEGDFILQKVPAGSLILVASYLGFQNDSLEVSIRNADTIQVNFNLVPLAGQLDEIVVSANLKPTYVKDSPVKIDVITAQQLASFMPSAASSIMESIQMVNGVQEVTACGVCYTNSISINGLDGAYTAVLLDGMPIYGNLASVYGLNGIPNMIIDRFEVIKGPNSTLYGSEAVAGVINIITKNPAKQPLLSVDFMGTSHLESFGNIALAPKIGKSSGYLGLNYAYINNFEDLNQDGFGDNINLDRFSFFTKWKFNRKDNRLFQIAAKFYYEDRRNGVEAFLKNRAYQNLRGSDQIYGESIYTHRAEILGTYEFNLPTGLKLDFSLSHHDQNSYYGADAYLAKQSIAFANLIWNQTIGWHDLVAGLTTRYNAYDDNSLATESIINGAIVNQPDNQFIPGIFLQDEMRLGMAATLLPGLRLDHYANHGFILTPRISSKWKAGDWTRIRANFGTGFRVVNLFTEDHAFVTGQREVEIIEDLQPEQSYNFSFNINHVYSALGGTGTIDLESYFTHFTNKILPDYDTPGKIIYANVSGFAQTKGIGISLDHRFQWPFAVNLGWNLQVAEEVEKDVSGNTQREKIVYAPDWTGLANLNYNWKAQQLNLAVTARFTGPMQLPEVYDLGPDGEPLSESRPTRSRPFALINFQASKTFEKGLTLYGGIQNLTSYRQEGTPLVGYNDPTSPVGFSPYFDTSYSYAPNHGREFYLGIKWELDRSVKK
ncbi:MAG: TonB-dependent receptor [Saprospiraceae bacterium]|nr:TonB-dependent receptor [Saprospiraceae bacterium]